MYSPADVILNKGVKSSVLLWFRMLHKPLVQGSKMKIQVEMVNLWKKHMNFNIIIIITIIIIIILIKITSYNIIIIL